MKCVNAATLEPAAMSSMGKIGGQDSRQQCPQKINSDELATSAFKLTKM